MADCAIHHEPLVEVTTDRGTVEFCEWCLSGKDPRTFKLEDPPELPAI